MLRFFFFVCGWMNGFQKRVCTILHSAKVPLLITLAWFANRLHNFSYICMCVFHVSVLLGRKIFFYQAEQLGTKQIDEDGLLELIATLPGKESKEATPKQGGFHPQHRLKNIIKMIFLYFRDMQIFSKKRKTLENYIFIILCSKFWCK